MEEFGRVIKVTLSIAQQTNLLASGATFQAARGSEQVSALPWSAPEIEEVAKEAVRA